MTYSNAKNIGRLSIWWGKQDTSERFRSPDWVKGQLDEWLRAAGIARGRIFRRVTRMGRTWGDCMTEKSIWHIVKDCAKRIAWQYLATIWNGSVSSIAPAVAECLDGSKMMICHRRSSRRWLWL